MTSRFRLVLVAGCVTLAGCGDNFNAGPLKYVESELMTSDLKDKPALQQAVRETMAQLFGADPQHIRVPAGTGLPGGGVYLGNYIQIGEGENAPRKTAWIEFGGTNRAPYTERQAGGYSLYRTHCLHCHGVSGAGDGPTASFLYPRPRDYRKGLFKFTSTLAQNGIAKPTRDDLRKTIRQGLHGTSMPAFEPLMTEPEIEQVIDYVVFLSIRGEVERGLITEVAPFADEKTATLPEDEVKGLVAKVAGNWKTAESLVFHPPVPRVEPTRASVLRGRELFLGKTTHKLECTGCHGARAYGDGPSLVDQDVFNDVVFHGDPSTEAERLAKYPDPVRELWSKSLDEWGRPLRPANLNRGVYKGGRRPIDIFWRISKGINGAKMPAHYPAVDGEKIWDIVNFVLALPTEPALLDGARLPGAPVTPAVANR